MTGVMLHGVARAGAPRPPAAAPHLRIAVGPVTVLCTAELAFAADLSDPAVAAQTALAHHALLTAYATCGDVVPVRFGAVFSSRAAVAAHVVPEVHSFLRRLDYIAAAREYTLRIARAEGGGAVMSLPAETSGRDFLNLRRSLRDERTGFGQRQAQFVREVRERVAAHVRDLTLLPSAHLAEMALLVPLADLPALTGCAAALHSEALGFGLTLTMSGPWPAYSFAPPEVADA